MYIPLCVAVASRYTNTTHIGTYNDNQFLSTTHSLPGKNQIPLLNGLKASMVQRPICGTSYSDSHSEGIIGENGDYLAFTRYVLS